MILSSVLLFLLTISSNHAAPLSHHDSTWLRLLHYEKTLLGGYESRVKSSRFFISKDGATSPQKELEETIKAFQKIPQKDELDYRCLFPARFDYLKKFYDFSSPKTCPQFETWMQWNQVDKLYLMFASQYLSNPASAFGHTFLKMRNPDFQDYIQMTIGYAGQIPDDVSSFSYIYDGLTGGFEGKYQLTPFVGKLEEYNNMESRDIYAYPLKLSQKQIDFFFKHLYEVGNAADFGYLFLTENCSYMLLTLLEVLFPQKDLTSGFYLYTLPAETIIRLHKENLIEAPELYPSLTSQIEHKYSLMSSQEKSHFSTHRKNILNHQLKDLPENQLILEALLDVMRLLRADYHGSLPTPFKESYIKILKKRASLGKRPSLEPIKKEEFSLPHQGHLPRSVQLSLEHSKRGEALNLDLIPGVHRLGDLDAGFKKYSEIQVLNFKARYVFDEKKFELRDLTFLGFQNILPFNQVTKTPSWSFDIKFQNDRLRNCFDCYKLSSHGAIGLGFNVYKDLTLFGMAKAQAETGNFKDHSALFLGSHIGAISKLGKQFKALVSHSYLRDVSHYSEKYKTHQSKMELSYFPQKNYKIFLKSFIQTSWFEQKRNSYEHSLGGAFYF